jgi:hypothetical protein
MEGQHDYKKLPGAGFRRRSFSRVAGGASHTYLGKDHLLVVERPAPGVEDYRRLPLADIETIVVAPTRNGYVSLFVASLLILGAVWLTLTGAPVGTGLGVIIAVLVSVFLIGELIKGPTARTLVRTQVQEIELASCNRQRAARKTLKIIEPLILAAQRVEVGEHRSFEPESGGGLES